MKNKWSKESIAQIMATLVAGDVSNPDGCRYFREGVGLSSDKFKDTLCIDTRKILSFARQVENEAW